MQHPHSRRMGVMSCLALFSVVFLLISTRHVSGQYDENQLMNLFAPPQQQQQQQGPGAPPNINMWQQQQAGGMPQQMMQPQQQQQQQAPMVNSAVLTELAVALLRAAQAGQQAPVQQQQQPQQQQVQYQDPNVNLYGARAPAPQQQNSQDLALLQAQAAPRDTILPLAHQGSSSYGFDMPPEDVKQRMRARIPKPISDLERFRRIPSAPHKLDRRALPRGNRVQSLESEFRRQPNRRIPPPPPQRTFHIRTQHQRGRTLEHTVDPSAMARVHDQNPFVAEARKKVESTELNLENIDEPALIAISEAESALAEADSVMTTPVASAAATATKQEPSVMEAELAQEEQNAAMIEMATTQKVKTKARTKTKAKVKHALPGRRAQHSEFAQREPPANFNSMFRSIMKARKSKRRASEY